MQKEKQVRNSHSKNLETDTEKALTLVKYA